MPARLRQAPAATPSLGRVRALSVLANLFADYLPLSLHLVQPGKPGVWHALVPPLPGLHPVQFEIFLKAVSARYAYHARCLAQARRRRGPFEAEQRGLWDCVVPTQHADQVVFAGPYLTALPEAAVLKSRFAQLSRRREPGPEMRLAYCRSVLDTAVLPPEARKALAFACDFAQQWYLQSRGPEAEALEELKPLFARQVGWRMERFAEARRERLLWWAAQSQGLASWDRRDFGLKELPGAVLAFSLASPGGDAVEELLQAARLREQCFQLAVDRQLIAGRSLGEGACLLLPAQPRGRAAADALAVQARELCAALSRRLGATVSVGWSQPLGGPQLPEAFRQAEWALLMALPRGLRHLAYAPGSRGSDPALESFEAGKALERAVLAGGLAELSAAKEAALGNALRLFPGRSDLLRPELMRLSLQIYEALARRSLLEGPALEAQRREALAGLRDARSARELAGAFSALVDRLGQLSVSPRQGASALRVRQAKRVLDEQALPADLASAAALAGLSRSRFSRLFGRENGEAFGERRRRLRLELAAQLLRQGALPIWRVAQECAYRSASHFGQAFRQAFGQTPAAYRRAKAAQGRRSQADN